MSQMICLSGVTTDPDTPGTEKVVCTAMQSAWLTGNASNTTVDDLELSGCGLAHPQTIFMVKGWNRSVCTLGVLLCIYQTPGMLEAGG